MSRRSGMPAGRGRQRNPGPPARCSHPVSSAQKSHSSPKASGGISIAELIDQAALPPGPRLRQGSALLAAPGDDAEAQPRRRAHYASAGRLVLYAAAEADSGVGQAGGVVGVDIEVAATRPSGNELHPQVGVASAGNQNRLPVRPRRALGRCDRLPKTAIRREAVDGDIERGCQPADWHQPDLTDTPMSPRILSWATAQRHRDRYTSPRCSMRTTTTSAGSSWMRYSTR